MNKERFTIGIWDRVFPSRYFIDTDVDIGHHIFDTEAEAKLAAFYLEQGYYWGKRDAETKKP